MDGRTGGAPDELPKAEAVQLTAEDLQDLRVWSLEDSIEGYAQEVELLRNGIVLSSEQIVFSDERLVSIESSGLTADQKAEASEKTKNYKARSERFLRSCEERLAEIEAHIELCRKSITEIRESGVTAVELERLRREKAESSKA